MSDAVYYLSGGFAIGVICALAFVVGLDLYRAASRGRV